MIGYRFHRCSAWTILDDPHREEGVQRLSMRPMENRYPRLKQCGIGSCGAGLQGRSILPRSKKLLGGVSNYPEG